jgi:hypothetical protein
MGRKKYEEKTRTSLEERQVRAAAAAAAATKRNSYVGWGTRIRGTDPLLLGLWASSI